MNKTDDGKIKILILDNNIESRKRVKEAISPKERFKAIGIDNDETALELMDFYEPDLLIFNLNTDGISPIDFYQKIVAKKRNLRTILIGEHKHHDFAAEILSREKFVDYMDVPISFKLLDARIHRFFQETKQKKPIQFENDIIIGNLSLSSERQTVKISDRNIHLNKSEFKLLNIFTRNLERVFSRNQIITHLRGYDYNVSHKIVDNYIAQVRKKIKTSSFKIDTVHGIGYKGAVN